jgi:hypothetical protein
LTIRFISAEPLSKASMLVRMAKDPDAWLYPCDDSEQIFGRKSDVVPNHLFGQNPYAREYADRRKLPLLAALGGVETMYPELANAIRDTTAAENLAKARMMPPATGCQPRSRSDTQGRRNSYDARFRRRATCWPETVQISQCRSGPRARSSLTPVRENWPTK